MTTPRDWRGSAEELLVYNELRRRGMQPGIDFFFQSPILGGRRQKGGFVVDFTFAGEYSWLAFAVQGTYWHYGQGSAKRAQDRILRTILAGRGITLIFLDDDDVAQNVRYYVSQGLMGIDHSTLSR